MGDISQWWKNPHLPKTVHLVHGCGIVWQKQFLFAYSPKFKARSWECMRWSKPSIWCQQRKRVHRVHEWGERLVWARTAPPRWRPSHIPDKTPLVDLFPLSSFLFTCCPLFSFHISQTSAHLYLLPLFLLPFFRFFASILQQRVTCEWHPVLALPQRVDCFVLKTYDTNTGRTQKHKHWENTKTQTKTKTWTSETCDKACQQSATWWSEMSQCIIWLQTSVLTSISNMHYEL